MTTKKLFLCYAATALLFSAHGNLLAQWQTSGTNINNTNSGNVGIGTSNPLWPMHVSRSSSNHVSFVVENTYGGSTRTYLLTMPGKSMISATHDFAIETLNGTWTDKFTIKANGNVGIGTTSPTQKLHVAGNIRAIGTVNANEVKVTVGGGADFVFAPNYRLRTLAEVQQFVNANKHLPEIAPAAEMVKNGVNIGELQMQLLLKIEELTLYIIDLEKRLSEMETR